MKVLITGATGKLGRATADALAVDGHELALLSRKQVAPGPHTTSYSADLARPEQAAEVLRQAAPDVVIHLAALLPALCKEDPDLARRVNVDATRELAHAAVASGVRTFIFASTGMVYNQGAAERPATENDPIPEPLPHPYSATKRQAEVALQEVAEQGGSTQFAVLRIFNIYGPGFDDSFVNKLAHSTAQNPAQLLGMEHFARDFVHSQDVVGAVRAVAERDRLPEQYNVWNIASGKATTNADLIRQLQAQGIAPHYTDTGQDVHSVSWADIGRAQADLGFNPRTGIDVAGL